MSRSSGKLSKTIIATGVFAIVGALTGLSVVMTGQPTLSGNRMGLVDDWTTHHVIFSNPGTFTEAVAHGRSTQWYRTVTNPRYIMQHVKRTPVSTASAANPLDPATSSSHLPIAIPDKARPPKRDWSFSIGGGTVAQNMSPAKFTFSPIGAPNCTTDYVAYGLNVAGSTGTSGQANLVALNELYSGTGTPFCAGHAGPSVYWAYDVSTNGGAVTTSPVLSEDGTKVIFVESVSGGSYLHVLVWNSSDGGGVTGSTVRKPTDVLTAGQGLGSCTAGASCLVSIKLNTTSITNSSPFYNYANDTAYIGDDGGNLWEVTPVLGSGTPSVSTTKAVVASGSILTGPVYDYNSGNIFVGATNGVLYGLSAASFATATPSTVQVGHANTCGSNNNVLVDPPVVDSTNGWVYEFSTDNPSNETVVVQASTSGPFTTQNVVDVGQGDNGCDSSSEFPTHSVDFDNNYYTGTTGASGTIEFGHIWVCGRNGGSSSAELWEIPTSAKVSGSYTGSISGVTAVQNGSQIQNSTSHAQCSPFTEIYNGSTDYLFFGEGLTGGGGFGRLYGFTLGDGSSTSEAATEISGSPLTYPTATGGTSAIVIDNVSADAQASSLYFTTLAKSGSICGSTSAYCAIKLTQSGLN